MNPLDSHSPVKENPFLMIVRRDSDIWVVDEDSRHLLEDELLADGGHDLFELQIANIVPISC